LRFQPAARLLLISYVQRPWKNPLTELVSKGLQIIDAPRSCDYPVPGTESGFHDCATEATELPVTSRT
jgi:hypothetical protein